ncbi:ATP-dependent RNA helicase dbp4 [Physcia stellaris]|nr:ATP-dependent RNA helicase dbp4 [Physcia stellaris]
MAPLSTKRKRPGTSDGHLFPRKKNRAGEDFESLDQRVQELDPEDDLNAFADLPLSQPTATGLDASHFKTLTDIQKRGIPLALKGSDILGAAKTGSGKTLAFLVPVLDNLYRRRWTDMDGLGALILSPTRELAVQIFEVLRKIGRYHTFSAGLVIGGKSLQEERDRLGRMNILVCTPGRMLQHMDQTAAFEIDNLQMLVLDEADRIMDMGFQDTVDAIVEHLPKTRQTLLFSATQTKKVSDLGRLSLKDPEYVSVHEAASSATPSTLQQHYIITTLQNKLDTLWSFIRSNLKSKILVFLSSGKQVRFVYETFRHLQPGVPLMHLHGRQKQNARLEITSKFSSSKHSCLFATDVVARGLDFPAVDWVIQLDCPEDADTYIHRVGRTARYEQNGRAVLFLEPTEEEGMLRRLEHKKVPIERINVRQKKQQSIKNQLQNMCFRDPELKHLGQQAFVSYVRSIHVQKDKEVFKLSALPLEEFSASLGLPGAPKIKFMKGDNAKRLKNAPRQPFSSSEDEEDRPAKADGDSQPKKPAVRTRYDRMFQRTNRDILSESYSRLVNDGETGQEADTTEADDGAFLTVKRTIHPDSEGDNESAETAPPTSTAKVLPGLSKTPMVIDSKRKEKLLKSKKKLLKLRSKGTRLVFDDQGHPHEIYDLENETQFKERGPADAQKAQFLLAEQERLRDADVSDKQAAKLKKREKKAKRKAREAAERAGDGRERQVILTPYEGDDLEDVPGDLDSSPEFVEKRPRKWFEDDSENEGKFKRKRKMDADPDRLEDLEAMASGLLG